MSEFSHLKSNQGAQMVDVSGKSVTHREALASATVTLAPATYAKVKHRQIEKGDVLEAARLAGIMAGKKTADLIPLCHPLAIRKIDLEFNLNDATSEICIYSKAVAEDVTGVEMEALTSVTVAALTLYDMCKALQKDITITNIRLLEKTGGKSGTYRRDD